MSLLTFGLFAVNPASAQERHIKLISDSVSPLTIRPGSTITITTDLKFENLVVGEQKIADIVPLSERSLYVHGRALGVTNITIYGKSSKLLGVINVRVERDFSHVRSAVRSVAPKARIRIANVNNRIYLTGTANDGNELKRVLEVAQQFSGKPVINALKVRAPQQVALEVRVIEATRRAGRELGVSWGGRGGSASVWPGINTGVNTGPAAGLGTLPTNIPFGTMVANVLSTMGVRIDVAINALEQKGLARRLAQPNLTTVSGETAKFHVGGEVPIQTAVASGSGVATSIEYRPFGVRLEFVPTVLDNSRVNLRVMTEVSDIDNTINVNGNPGFSSRKAEAVIELRDGQSFAMAGLLETVNERDVDQIPWLGQVPILGALFRSTAFQKRETDLVIVVTPRLVRPASPDEKLHSPLDKSKPSNDWELFALGLMEVNKDMVRKFRDGEGVAGPYGHIIDLEFGDGYVLSKK